jgi:DEXQ-box helicase domain of Suv3
MYLRLVCRGINSAISRRTQQLIRVQYTGIGFNAPKYTRSFRNATHSLSVHRSASESQNLTGLMRSCSSPSPIRTALFPPTLTPLQRTSTTLSLGSMKYMSFSTDHRRQQELIQQQALLKRKLAATQQELQRLELGSESDNKAVAASHSDLSNVHNILPETDDHIGVQRAQRVFTRVVLRDTMRSSHFYKRARKKIKGLKKKHVNSVVVEFAKVYVDKLQPPLHDWLEANPLASVEDRARLVTDLSLGPFVEFVTSLTLASPDAFHLTTGDFHSVVDGSEDIADAEQIDSIDLTMPHEWYPLARSMRRKFVLHLGPTNSGKVMLRNCYW